MIRETSPCTVFDALLQFITFVCILYGCTGAPIERMVFEYKQLAKNNFFSYFLNLINICHNSHNCICIPYIGHEM